MRQLLLTLTVTPILMASCAGDGDFSRFAALPEGGWAYGDTVRFDTERPDSLSRGNLTLALRHTNDYSFANIWLEVSMNDSGRQRRDTLNLCLADDYGRWQGKGFGSTRQLQAEVAHGVSPAPGSEITVRHIMRVDTLRGVREIGVSFVEYKE